MRLDKYLVEKGYFTSRNKALMAINNNAIYVNDKLIDKASYEVNEKDIIKIKEDNVLKYVSRGGLKLESAIKHFNLDFKDKVILDIGSSTGGFTDCALTHGASFAYCVDVGSNQLADKLRNDSRVEVHEETNILELPKFDKKIDILLLDCSFVSVSKLIPAIKHYLNDDNYLVLLIKPQFEVGHINIKNGIIKDKKIHLKVLDKVYNELALNNLYINKIIKSDIKGTDGNQEFLAIVSKKFSQKMNFLSII